MAKKRTRIKRIVAPVVSVVKRARSKLDRGKPRMSGQQIAATVGGAVAGGLATQSLQRMGASPAVAAIGVTGLGAAGAYFLDGAPQAVAVGAATGGLMLAATQWMTKLAPGLPAPAPSPPAPEPAKPAERRAAMLPSADVQAAFDAARAQLHRSPTWSYAYAWPQA